MNAFGRQTPDRRSRKDGIAISVVFPAWSLPPLLLALVSFALAVSLSEAPRPECRGLPVCVEGASELNRQRGSTDDDQTADDRDAILELIRAHRRTASEGWRQTLADAVYEESMAASVDPLIVASIVAKESSFKSQIVSHAGAVGLMQLRPFVARDVAQRSDIEWDGLQTLHSPRMNVRLGILYYKELMDRFDGDRHTALTAYNFGPTRVSRQLRTGTFSGSDYAADILGLYDSLNTGRGTALVASLHAGGTEADSRT